MYDIPTFARSKLIMFADDIKLWAQIRNQNDCFLLQQDLSLLYNWSLKNKFTFNLAKCKMLNIGRPFTHSYFLGCKALHWTIQEKDLGEWIAGSLKSTKQCEVVYQRASRLLTMFRRLFGRFRHNSVPTIVNAFLRPTMEYAVRAWCLWLIKDIELLQRIYHRVSKLADGLQNLPYEERMKRLRLFDFTYRRMRGDLILLFKIMKTSDHPLQCLFNRRPALKLHSHDHTLQIPHSRVDCRRNFFSVRVCYMWNSLPQNLINCQTVSEFKLSLDKYMTIKKNSWLLTSNFHFSQLHILLFAWFCKLIALSYGYCKVLCFFNHKTLIYLDMIYLDLMLRIGNQRDCLLELANALADFYFTVLITTNGLIYMCQKKLWCQCLTCWLNNCWCLPK